MLLGVNYSNEALALRQSGSITIDRWKLPAWHDLVAQALGDYPGYVHFPLNVGGTAGSVIDSETRAPVDWAKVDALMAQTETPIINLHFAPTPHDCPGIPQTSTDPAHIEQVVEAAIRGVEIAAARYGRERVIVENSRGETHEILYAALTPEGISRVVRETGVGFLLDISHARLAAISLAWNAREYINALPVDRLCELHVTGIHLFAEPHLARLRANGVPEEKLRLYAGRLQDHLPLTDADWDFLEWAAAQIDDGAWAVPWITSFEYGGVGAYFRSFSDEDVIRAQVPRMYSLLHRL